MASVIILAPPTIDSAPRIGREPARASVVADVRAVAWRKAEHEAAPQTPAELEIETPTREDDDGAAETRQMGRRALTLTAEKRSSAWRWDDEAAGEATYTPVGFTAQRIAQEVLSPGLYHEDFRSALAAYGYAADVGATAVVREDRVSIVV
jgi:hypothetical protein